MTSILAGGNGGGGGGGGGPVTVADGADVAQGSTADVAYVSGSGTIVGVLKAIFIRLRGGQATMANSLPIAIASDQSAIPVSGTVTANVGTTNGIALDATLTGGTQKSKLVDTGGTNVASVSAAGALKVDNSAVTQPVSGTVTANVGTTNGLALDATLTGGTQKSKLVDTGGTNVASVSAAGALKVDGSAVTQPVSGTVTANAGTGNFTSVGNVASAVADSGNPVKIGGKYNQTPITLVDQQRGDLQLMSDGSVKVYPRSLTAAQDTVAVQPVAGATFTTIAQGYDAFLNPISSYAPGGNSSGMLSVCPIATKTLVSLAAGTVFSSTSTSADLDVSRFSEITFDFKSTGVNAGTTPTITITINRKGADGTYYPIYTTGAIAGATPTVISAQLGRGYPTAQTSTTATGYGSFAISLGSTLQVVATIGGTVSPSVTCGYSVIAKM